MAEPYQAYFASAGVPATGLTPSWHKLTDLDGNDEASKPAISEITDNDGNEGWYTFSYTATETMVGVIDGGATLADADRYVKVKMTPDDNMAHTVSHIPKYTGDIWFVSKSGDDSNTGKDPHYAFLTIGAAISAASAGDRIYVKAGTYAEAVVLNVASAELVCESGTLITGAGGTAVTVSASYCRLEGATATPAAGQVGFAWSGLLGVAEGCIGYQGGTGFAVSGLFNQFLNCLANNNTTTGWSVTANTNKFYNCYSNGAGATRGWYITGTTSNNTFQGCNSLGHTTASFEFGDGADGNIMATCVVDIAVTDHENNTDNILDYRCGSQISPGQCADQDVKDTYDKADAAVTAVGDLKDFDPANDEVDVGKVKGAAVTGVNDFKATVPTAATIATAVGNLIVDSTGAQVTLKAALKMIYSKQVSDVSINVDTGVATYTDKNGDALFTVLPSTTGRTVTES